ncbi:uncharacterized protein G2W53_027555 [Senna tora]|uniref:Uncharacterized protein n=1 Tax=Senna tora TaxID=362788 RepID=A0A834TJG5_9FABA|nr:uncharacterized protein G2W53_027555 [Senna tora]
MVSEDWCILKYLRDDRIRTILRQAYECWEVGDLDFPRRATIVKGEEMFSEEECLLGYLSNHQIRSTLLQAYVIVPPSQSRFPRKY